MASNLFPSQGDPDYAAKKQAAALGQRNAGAGPRQPDTLGFGTNASEDYFEKNPSDAFQFYVNKLGGVGSTLGRYASARFGEVYADYLKQAAANPNLLWTDYLNKYAGGSQLTQQFLSTAPQLRGQQVAPWSQSRFLG